MPTKEDMLYEHTFKDVDDDVGKRVFYTLTQEENLTVKRNSKLLSILIARLRNTNAISEDELDDILVDII